MLPVAATSAGLSNHRSVSLRLPSAARGERSFGFVTFTTPGAWTRHPIRPHNPFFSAYFTFGLASGCATSALVNAESSITRVGALAQLRNVFQRLLEPGVPRPSPVRTVAIGRTKSGSGAWEVASSGDPNALPLGGAVLVKVGHHRWAGLNLVVDDNYECRTELLQHSGQPRAIETLLRTITLHPRRAG
jgi:hypothetical protein